MTKFFSSRLATLVIGAALATISFASHAAAFETCCEGDDGPSWIFAPAPTPTTR